MPTTVKDYQLNAKQITVLKLTYKFRYMSAPLLAELKGTNHSVANSALRILFEKGYLGRRYDKTYKLRGKAASYFLGTKGLQRLRKEPDLSEDMLKAMYKNRSLSLKFIDHNLDVAQVYLSLKESYPKTFHIFTKSELSHFDYFPVPAPDLYLNRINPKEGGRNEYLLDTFADTPLFIIKKRIAAYMKHYEDGEWEGSDYPIVLIVAPDAHVEQQLQAHIANQLENQGLDDELTFYTTNFGALQSGEVAIWRDPIKPEVLISLDGL